MSILNVEHLSHGFGDRAIFGDVSFRLLKGEHIGLVGANGEGKSTFLNIVTGKLQPDEGKIEWAKHVRVGYLDQHTVLEKGMTIRDVLASAFQFLFGLEEQMNAMYEKMGEASDEEMRDACRLACAHEFVESFPDGYDTYIEQGGANVSGGQKQRLCIARALLKKPKILILDDSTSAVDTKTDAYIRKSMREYIPETTKIIIAQRISSIKDADMIIVMDDGKITGIGTHDELLGNNAEYSEIYWSQNEKKETEVI
jgi:ATP-binding cassette subfamily B protein